MFNWCSLGLKETTKSKCVICQLQWLSSSNINSVVVGKIGSDIRFCEVIIRVQSEEKQNIGKQLKTHSFAIISSHVHSCIVITHTGSRPCSSLVWISNKYARTHFLTVQTWRSVQMPADRDGGGWETPCDIVSIEQKDWWDRRKTAIVLRRESSLAFVESQLHKLPDDTDHYREQWTHRLPFRGWTTANS